MITIVFFPPQGDPQIGLDPSSVPALLDSDKGFLWVSLENPTREESESILRDIFKFHPLAIEDCLSTGYQPPKVDDFGIYLFIIAHAIHPTQDFDRLDTVELNLFLGRNYLVSSHMEADLHPVTHVRNLLQRDSRLCSNGADFLCHAILDVLVDDYMPIIDQMDEEIEWLEDSILAKPNSQTLERILNLKHTLMALRRIISPQREIMNRLSRDDFDLIDSHTRIYYRDIYDHLVRIQDLTETVRDIVTGALDIYLNSTSLRLNNIMKALTIVSTIFLPMSFIAGVYGMNFHMMPELAWRYGYLFAWILFIAIFVGLISFFKKRGWF